MIEILISLLIVAIIVIVVFYVIDLLGLPAPVPMIAKLIVGLVVLLWLLQSVVPGHFPKIGMNNEQAQIVKIV